MLVQAMIYLIILSRLDKVYEALIKFCLFFDRVTFQKFILQGKILQA